MEYSKDQFDLFKLKQIQTKKRIRLWVIFYICFSISLIIYIAIHLSNEKQETITDFKNRQKTIDSIANLKSETKYKSLDSSKNFKFIGINKIECTARHISEKTKDGKDEYLFTFKMIDTSLITKLDSVGYFFNDISFNPKLKISKNSKSNFSYFYKGYGWFNTIKVFFYYKNNTQTDSLFFPMSAQTKFRDSLPTVNH